MIKHFFIRLYFKLRYAFTSRDESGVPTGPYCYERVHIPKGEETLSAIAPCPHYRRIQDVAWCSLTNEGDCILLDDMVKVCGINEDYD